MLSDSGKTVRVVAWFRARPGCGPQLREVLETLVEPTCREEGCLLYQLNVNPKDPTDLVFIEEWASEEALEAHSKSTHLETARSKFPPLIDSGPDVRTYLLVR
jgi:quinol monooxygenase YgiN